MLSIIPTPKHQKTSAENFLNKATITDTGHFRSESDVFSEYAGRLGVNFTYTAKGYFTITPDLSLPSGAYRISVTKDSVMLFASDTAGANHAFATLLQIMKCAGDSSENVIVPCCEITDYASYSYRGMMVDLARNWHDFSYLLSYVDMCYFYKVSSLQLHFTENQSYTLPSILFPKLSTEGRHYSWAQIAQLVEYAHARSVELIPEIDVPGHCVSFQQFYPEVFGTMGVICHHQKSIEAVKALFGELCDMFPYSAHIHIGGDEAEIQNWNNCPECMDYAREIGIDTSMEDRKLLAEHLYVNFVSEMADAVFEKGRTPIAWEGFAKEVNHLISKNIIIMSWENYYQLTPDLLKAGFQVINCSWNPMYVVTPEAFWTQREIFDWSVYKWTPVHQKSPYYGTTLEIEPSEQVMGGQLHAWGDAIARSFPTAAEGVFAERELLLERLPVLAENTWNSEKAVSFEDFMVKYKPLGEKLILISG